MTTPSFSAHSALGAVFRCCFIFRLPIAAAVQVPRACHDALCRKNRPNETPPRSERLLDLRGIGEKAINLGAGRAGEGSLAGSRLERPTKQIQLTRTTSWLDGCTGALTASAPTLETVLVSSDVASEVALAGTTGSVEGVSEEVEGAASAALLCTPFPGGDTSVGASSLLFEAVAAGKDSSGEHGPAVEARGDDVRCLITRQALPTCSIGSLPTRNRIALTVPATTKTSSSILERHTGFSGASIPKGTLGWMAESFNLNSLGSQSSSLWLLGPDGPRRLARKETAISTAPKLNPRQSETARRLLVGSGFRGGPFMTIAATASRGT